jgi:hypothetical protein
MAKRDSTSTTRREFVQRSATALAFGAAVPAAVISKSAQSAGPDPILTAIEAHKRDVERHMAIVLADIRDPGDQTPETDEILYSSYDEHHDVIHSLLTTKPTTIAGVAAILEYIVTSTDCYEKLTNWDNTIFCYAMECEDLTEAAQGLFVLLADAVRGITAVA